jgi:hypothetical protein
MKFKTLIIAFLAASLAACGPGLEGEYTDARGLSTYTFESDGTLTVRFLGQEKELEYEMDGNKIKIITARGGKAIMTLSDDESSISEGASTLTKK